MHNRHWMHPTKTTMQVNFPNRRVLWCRQLEYKPSQFRQAPLEFRGLILTMHSISSILSAIPSKLKSLSIRLIPFLAAEALINNCGDMLTPLKLKL
jgi:hypothetical protein